MARSIITSVTLTVSGTELATVWESFETTRRCRPKLHRHQPAADRSGTRFPGAGRNGSAGPDAGAVSPPRGKAWRETRRVFFAFLLVLPQLPQDPASGAARSTRTICELVSRAGFEVRVVATTASERAGHHDPVAYLGELGIVPHVLPGRTKTRVRPEYQFHDRSVSYRLLDVGPREMLAWQKIHGKQFDQMFDDELHRFRPDVVMGFGGHPSDIARFDRARRQGARVVFALRNQGYLVGFPNS